MNKKGVTLLELIIVMVIIGIGAVLLAPNITNWLPNYRLRGATRDVVSTLRTAQIKAVTTNMQYRVSFTPGTGSAASYILQRNSGGWINEGGTSTLPSGITMTVSGGNDKLFNPDSTSSTGSITLSGGKGTKRITFTTATGRINIE